MLRSTSRGGGMPLALLVTTLAALGGCTDNEPFATGPSPRPTRPNLAVGDVITVTSARGTTEAGTLRWAVAQATGGEIIRFDARLAGSTLTLDSTLVIQNYLTIEGPADKGITISGGANGRVIEITPMLTTLPPTTLRNVAITGGKLGPNDGGAGIRAQSPVVLEHTTVWGNEAVGSPAILGYNNGRITLVNSTVSGNTSTGYGYPAISAAVSLELTNSTVAYNSQGGISAGYLAQVVLRNSIISNNGFSNCVLDDNVTLEGTNLSNDMSCGDDTMLLIADPKLAPLANNDGPSMTHALAPESPAFNAAPGCTLQVDQRYESRDSMCDIGAFESTDPTTVSLTIDRVGVVSSTGTFAIVTGYVKCSRAGDQIELPVQAQQKGSDRTVVQGGGTVTVTCSTTAQKWSATVYPSAGLFKSGRVSVTATTQNVPSWMTPATASRGVKLS
jgi:hypothetical protein